MKRMHTFVLIAVLLGLGLGLMHAKVTQLGLPLSPGQLEPVWAIEAKVEFNGSGGAAIVDLDIPDDLGDYILIDEYFASRGYGLNIETLKKDRRAEWSTRRASGRQRLYYRIEVAAAAGDDASAKRSGKSPRAPKKPKYQEPLASAISDLLGEVRAESADIFTFVSQLLVRLNDPDPDASVTVVRGSLQPGSEAWAEQLIYVLAGARISARLVRGLVLADGVQNESLVHWLEVHNGKRWEGFDPTSGSKGYPENFVRWTVGSSPMLEVDGGRNAKTSFSMSRYAQSLTAAARDRAEASNSWISRLLLFNLPVSTQNVFRVLLMVPIGALVVAFMRTIVGVPTLGTFMPILIALAFRETELVLGVMLFTLVVAAGLSLRFYMERLQLLLVPRLCAVLVVVVLLMLVIALVSSAAGFDVGFSIALFPIVILSMVIEHLSVVWEESGPGEVFKQGLGSLLVAVLGYLVMNDDYLTHVVFLFPEVLLLVLVVFILMGRYTGYRFTEILRFRDIVADGKGYVQPRS